MEDVEDLELEELAEVDMELVQYHCEAAIMVPHMHEQQLWKVRVVPDNGAGESCISEKMAAELEAHSKGTSIAYLTKRTTKARGPDGRELAIK